MTSETTLFASSRLRVRCEGGSLIIEDAVGARVEAIPIDDLASATWGEELSSQGTQAVVCIDARARAPLSFGPLPMHDAEGLLRAVRQVLAHVREQERGRTTGARHDADPNQVFRRGTFRIIDKGDALAIEDANGLVHLGIYDVSSVTIRGERIVVDRRDELVRFGPFPEADRGTVLRIMNAWMQREKLDDTLHDVTEPALRSTPTKFHKLRVRVSCVWQYGFERSDLAGAWVVVGKRNRPRFLDDEGGLRRARHVRVEGRWISNGTDRYGHFDLAPAQLLVDSLEDFGPAPSH